MEISSKMSQGLFSREIAALAGCNQRMNLRRTFMKKKLSTCILVVLLLLTIVAPASAVTDDISTLQMYSRVANYYSQLELYGANLENVSTSDLYTAYMDINYLNNTDSFNQQAKYFNNTINDYNKLASQGKDLESEMIDYGINPEVIECILDEYSQAIEFYKCAFDSLKSYSVDRSAHNLQTFSAYSEKGFDSSYKGCAMSIIGYNIFYSAIQNYSNDIKNAVN
jgi:hypothetical protein